MSLRMLLSFSGSVAVSRKFQDKSSRHIYARLFDYLVFPAKGGNALVTVKINDKPYWVVLLNISDDFIPDEVIEGSMDLEFYIIKDLPERHFALARATKFVLRYRKTEEEIEYNIVSDRLQIASGIVFSEAEKIAYNSVYEIVLDLVSNTVSKNLIEKKELWRERIRHLERNDVVLNNELDKIPEVGKYRKWELDKILRHAIFSKYVIYNDTWNYSGLHLVELDRELSIDDLLELSKAYVIVIRHLVIPIRGKDLHIHDVIYNGQRFKIVTDTYLFKDPKVFAKRRKLSLSEYYRKKIPKYITLEDPNRLFDALEFIQNARKLEYKILSPLEQLYELFYERIPRDNKQKYFEYYFELYNKILEITKGKTRLLISFPKAFRFRVFRITKTKSGFIKVRAWRYHSKIPSQLWIRGRFLKAYIESNNLKDYMHFLFMDRQKKLEILKKYFREFYRLANVNPSQLALDMSWEQFVRFAKYWLPQTQFLNAIHKYFEMIEKGKLDPQYAKKEDILEAYNRFLFALKNYKPEKLLEPKILKWIRNAIKYYLAVEHNIKPKAGLVIAGNPSEILRGILEKVKSIDDKELVNIIVNQITELEVYTEAKKEDEELDILVQRLRMDLVF